MLQKEWARDLAELGDRLATLTLAEAAVLSDYLADVHGVKAAAVATPGIERQDADEDEDRTPVPESLDVVLEPCAEKDRIAVIRVVREVFGLGLREARDLVAAAPKVIKEGASAEEAEALKSTLSAAGAAVSVRPSVTA